MIPDLEFQSLWERLQMAAGDVLDAINAQNANPKADISQHLTSAANRSAKANVELRQILLPIKR